MMDGMKDHMNEVPVDCMQVSDEGTDISCKSEASGTLVLSDLVKFVAISNDLPGRISEFVAFHEVSLDPPLVVEAGFPDIFLLLCSFLK